MAYPINGFQYAARKKHLNFIKRCKTERYGQHFLTFPIDCSIMFTKPFKLL